MEEYFSAERLLDLSIASLVKINSEERDLTFNASLVGVANADCIITSLPSHFSLPPGIEIKEAFRRGKMYEMSTIHKGRVVAFESAVLDLYEGHLLISSFPEMIETKRIRKDIRFPCSLSCDIVLSGQDPSGVIVDISLGGCQLNIPNSSDISYIGKAISDGSPITLSIFFPTIDTPEQVVAFIQSHANQVDGTCSVGLKFAQEYECIRRYLESLELDSIAPFFF